MKISALKYAVLSWVSILTMLIFFLMPFHAFLTVWLSSLVGHYTVLRLWCEVVLVICVFGVIYLLLTDHKIRTHTLTRRLVQIILCYIALNIALGIISLNDHDVTAKALGYGLIVDLRPVVFFLVTWAVALRMMRLRSHWKWLVLWPATIVVIVGLLQIVLPHDIMRHFGYGPNTIPITETINHNIRYVRIFSTLRGANPLGAYLLIPISLLTVLLLRPKHNWRQGLLLIASAIVLFYTFSRSAWIGAILSVGIILLIETKTPKSHKIALSSAAALILILAGLGVAYRHNVSFQNFVLHTQTNSAVKTTSNDNHLSAIKSGLHDLVHNPLGRGPGTAGPASYYNNNKPRIAENFFIQIGQETGWIGLILFILINAGLGYLLWLRRGDPLALSLFASLIGLTLINMVSHAWSDETLSYIWWGLAGVAMAPDKRLETAQTTTTAEK